MAVLDKLFGLVLLAAIFWWLWQRLHRFQALQISETTRPLTPQIPLLKQLIYAWWLITGLWLEKTEQVSALEQPLSHTLSLWTHRIALILIGGMFIAVLYDWLHTV